jgi:hypothetical protein
MKSNLTDPIAKLINIGSNRLHIYTTREGNPSVVLEAGGLSWCLDWYLVQTQAAVSLGDVDSLIEHPASVTKKMTKAALE